MGNIFALQTVTAGDGLHQLAFLIAQHQGKPIQLPAEDDFPSTDELEDLIDGFGFAG